MAGDISGNFDQQHFSSHSSFRFQPPGPASVSFNRVSSVLYRAQFGQTIALLTTSSMLFSVGASLLLLAASIYLKCRKKQPITPFFFILAIFSGLSLLVLCGAHIALVKLRLRWALGCTKFRCRTSSVGHQDFFDQLSGADCANQLLHVIAQVENINLVLPEIVILMRIRALFPRDPWVQRIASSLLLASASSCIVYLGLRTSEDLRMTNAPTISLSSIYLSDGLADLGKGLLEALRKTVPSTHLAYIDGCLSCIVNGFATWLFITKWRDTRHHTSGIYDTRKSKKNDPYKRLQILIYAGLLLGLSQGSWYIFYTILSIERQPQLPTWPPPRAYDYVLSRFIFHAGSALYPVASYVALHWNTPSEEVRCVDLFDIARRSHEEVPLDDLDRRQNPPRAEHNAWNAEAET